MLSEKQIRAIIEECEVVLGRDLTELRKRLLRQRHTEANIWELIVLYGSLPLGKVIYEPTEGTPDICIESENGTAIWLEATYVYPRHQVHYNDLQNFPQWIREQLNNYGCSWALKAEIRLDPAVQKENILIPPRNKWSQMLRNTSWNEFVVLAKAQHSALWKCPIDNLKVHAARSPSPSVVAGYPVPDIPKHPREHPVYRTIEKKAKQVRDWKDEGNDYSPLFLILGTDDQSGRVDSGKISGVSTDQAIYAALADTSKWDPVTTYNKMGSWDGGRLRVSNSSLIAGVVFANFETSFTHLYTKREDVCKGTFYENPHPSAPLSKQRKDLVCQLQLNRVKYFLGLEDWRIDDKGNGLKRARRRGGNIVIKSKKDGAFEVEMPTILLTQILSGDVSAQEAWQHSPEIYNLFKSALVTGQELINARVGTSDSKNREEANICLSFGPPLPPAIRVKK